MGVSRDGTIKAYELDVKSNTGGYASHGHSIASAAANKIPYIYPRLAFGYKALTFYSNLPNAGAMRGYGAPQATFALESLVEEAAQKLGMDSVDFRLKKCRATGRLQPGEQEGNQELWYYRVFDPGSGNVRLGQAPRSLSCRAGLSAVVLALPASVTVRIPTQPALRFLVPAWS